MTESIEIQPEENKLTSLVKEMNDKGIFSWERMEVFLRDKLGSDFVFDHTEKIYLSDFYEGRVEF